MYESSLYRRKLTYVKKYAQQADCTEYFYRATLRHASAIFAVVMCLSVCLSVRPPEARRPIVSTRLYGQSLFLAWDLPVTYPELCCEEIRDIFVFCRQTVSATRTSGGDRDDS